MKLYSLLIVMPLFLVCCSSNETEESTTLRFFENSKVVIPDSSGDFFVTIGPGENLVFEYFFVAASDLDAVDSGFSETIIFEIDPSVSEFSISDNDLQSLNAYYRASCFCDNTESREITSGIISGTKLSEKAWNVEVNVNIDLVDPQETINKTISGDFILEE